MLPTTLPITNRVIKKTLILFLSTGVILFTVWQTTVDIEKLANLIKNIDSKFFTLAIIASIVAPFLNTGRWYFLLRLTGYHIHIKRVWSLTMATWTVSMLPGRIGDFLRSIPIKNLVPISISIGSIVFEKIIDISSLLILSILGFFMLKYWSGVIILTTTLIMLYTGLYITQYINNYLPEKIKEKLFLAFTVVRAVPRAPGFFIAAVFISLINWSASIATIFFTLQALGQTVPLALTLAYVPLAIFVGILPLSIAGIGTRDAALVLFLGMTANTTAIFTAGIVYSSLNYLLFSLLGIPYFIRESKNYSKQIV